MIFTKRTYKKAASRAYDEQDIQWKRRRWNPRSVSVNRDLTKAIMFKERIYQRWWRERGLK